MRRIRRGEHGGIVVQRRLGHIVGIFLAGRHGRHVVVAVQPNPAVLPGVAVSRGCHFCRGAAIPRARAVKGYRGAHHFSVQGSFRVGPAAVQLEGDGRLGAVFPHLGGDKLGDGGIVDSLRAAAAHRVIHIALGLHFLDKVLEGHRFAIDRAVGGQVFPGNSPAVGRVGLQRHVHVMVVDHRVFAQYPLEQAQRHRHLRGVRGLKHLIRCEGARLVGVGDDGHAVHHLAGHAVVHRDGALNNLVYIC